MVIGHGHAIGRGALGLGRVHAAALIARPGLGHQVGQGVDHAPHGKVPGVDLDHGRVGNPYVVSDHFTKRIQASRNVQLLLDVQGRWLWW